MSEGQVCPQGSDERNQSNEANMYNIRMPKRGPKRTAWLRKEKGYQKGMVRYLTRP